MLPPNETDSVFGIHVAVMTGEPTRFEQLTVPGEYETKAKPVIKIVEISDTIGKRILKVAITFCEETAYHDNTIDVDARLLAEKAEKTPDALALSTTLFELSTTARILRSSGWLAVGFVTLDI